MPVISPAVIADLAPRGRLRVAIMSTNPVLARRDPVSGDLSGIAADLARELAHRVNMPLEIIAYETRASLLAGEWDVAFSSSDPSRTSIRCTAPFIDTEGTYLVHADSPLHTIDDVDREGVRIAVSAKSALDLHLSRTLKHATLERIPGAHAAAELLMGGTANAVAGLRQQLIRVCAKLPGSRLLPGRFMVISQGLAIPTGRNAGAAYLCAFVEDVKASGFIARMMERNGIVGASVSPPSSP